MESVTESETGCPRGCATADDCKASLAIPCPQGRYSTDESGKFQPCLEREGCSGCGACSNCDDCTCGEGDRG